MKLDQCKPPHPSPLTREPITTIMSMSVQLHLCTTIIIIIVLGTTLQLRRVHVQVGVCM